MKVEKRSYTDARKEMKAWDVIAFGGKGEFSQIIKLATFSPVSHVGTILQTKIRTDDDDVDNERFFNQIIEAAPIDGFNGVNISRFSDRLKGHKGEMWWLPLNDKKRKIFNENKFYNFLYDTAERRIEYDLPQAIQSAIDFLDDLPFGLHGPGYSKEDFSKFFCSELVAAGLEKSGITGTLNASEVTPIDLCQWKIFDDTYYQLTEDPILEIPRYNTREPMDWQ